MATEKIKRPLIAHFLDTTDKMGEYSTAKSVSYTHLCKAVLSGVRLGKSRPAARI